jgi:hypothetical protein
LAEGNGLIVLLRRVSAALSRHGVHYRLSRRLGDLSIEPGQTQQMNPFARILPPQTARILCWAVDLDFFRRPQVDLMDLSLKT